MTKALATATLLVAAVSLGACSTVRGGAIGAAGGAGLSAATGNDPVRGAAAGGAAGAVVGTIID